MNLAGNVNHHNDASNPSSVGKKFIALSTGISGINLFELVQNHLFRINRTEAAETYSSAKLLKVLFREMPFSKLSIKICQKKIWANYNNS